MELRESLYLESKPDVDAEAGVIRNVKFLGNDSENGRRYGLKVRQQSIGLYEGCRVNLNHPEGRNLERRVQDWVGELVNVRAQTDGNYGDLRLRTKHPEYEGLIEAASKFWKNFGLSHVAFGDEVKKGNVQDVRSIDQVMSVDIVTEPATCSNLFESRGRTMATATKRIKKRTIKAIVESTGKVEGDAKLFRQLLIESMEGEAPALSPETAAPVPEGASSDDAVKAGILAGIAAKLQDADGPTVEKVAKLLGLGTKLSDIVDGGKPADSTPPAGGDAPKEESAEMKEAKTKVARMEAKCLLLESGRKATEVMVDALAAVDATKRKALMESWPVADAKPSGKPDRSPPAFADDDVEEDADELTLIENRWKNKVEQAGKLLTEGRRR